MDGSVGGTVAEPAERAPAKPISNFPINNKMGGCKGGPPISGSFPQSRIGCRARGGREGLDDGRWTVDGRTRTSVTPAPHEPRSLSRLSIPTSHFGCCSQTGRAPFILEIGNGQVLAGAVCVTATVLTYHALPCLLNTEHNESLSIHSVLARLG